MCTAEDIEKMAEFNRITESLVYNKWGGYRLVKTGPDASPVFDLYPDSDEAKEAIASWDDEGFWGGNRIMEVESL